MRLGTYYRYLVSRKLELPLSGDKVLDIGCYDGFLLSHIDATKKFGIDIKPLRKYSNIQYIEGNFLKYGFKDENFDRIFAFDVLEHIKEDKEFLKKIVKLLSPNGIAILSTPSKDIKIFPPFLQSWVDKRWGHTYRRGYALREIRQLLIGMKNENNFKLDIIYWNCPFFRFFYLLLSLFWRVSSSLTKKILNFIVKLDSRFQKGNKGFLYIIIKVK